MNVLWDIALNPRSESGDNQVTAKRISTVNVIDCRNSENFFDR